jgi:hypothetical protein
VPPVVRRSTALEHELAEAADGPYEAQPLARKAPAARRRLLGLALVAMVVLLIELAFTRAGFPLVAALYVGACAWMLKRQKLGGIIGGAFAAILAITLPVAFWRLGGADAGDLFRGVVSIGLGLAAVPDLITLARDAELQYAYGRWATRDV